MKINLETNISQFYQNKNITFEGCDINKSFLAINNVGC